MNFPATDGAIFAAVQTNGILYVGGNFNQIGPVTGGFAAVSPSTGKAVAPIPYAWGTVSCSLSDPMGGVYFGGTFQGAGSLATTNLAHLGPNGAIDTNFTFAADGSVAALAISGTRLFVGGSFSIVDGVNQSNLVVLDIASNQLASFTVSVDGPVQALAVSGNLLYLGGAFSHVGGVPRANVAAVDLNTGAVTQWNPSPDSMFGTGVGILLFDGSRIYAAGDFTQIAGAARNQIAAFDANTGTLLAWDARVYVPYTAQTVHSFAVGSNAVYIGGNFSSLAGQPRSSIGAVDKDTGNALPWNPGIPWNTVEALAVSGNLVYVGGSFPGIGSNGPPRLAAIDSTSGVPTSWAPVPGGTVFTIRPLNGLVYVGGGFNSIGGVTRQVLAAIDLATGSVTSWDPHMGANAESGDYVYALAISGDTLFVGGRFFGIGSQIRYSLGAVRLSDASTLPFAPNLSFYGNPSVFGLFPVGTNLIVTGVLPLTGSPAILNATSGQVVNWSFGTDGGISAFAVSGNTLYIGGDFTQVSGQPRSRLAAFDVASRQLLPWSPRVDAAVANILPRDQTIIALGNFQMANGEARSQVAVFDALSGDLALGPSGLSLDGGINQVAAAADSLYLAGGFAHVNGVARGSFAALDLLTGQLRPWDPAVTPATGRTVVPTPQRVAVGGTFGSVAGNPRIGVAGFSVTNPPPVVQISAPTNNTVVHAPAELPLLVQAVSPSNSIAQVAVYVRTNLVLISTNGSIATNWFVPKHIGDYLVTAVAYDEYGESSFSPAARVTVLLPTNYVPPSLAITFPSNNTTYTFSNITVQTAISSPQSSVENVQFFLGTNLVGIVTNPPFTVTLSNLALGSYSVTAQLQDEFGIRATNGPIAFNVTKPPPFVTNAPVNLSLLAGTNWILHVFAVGDLPISYQWQFQGTNIPGATNISLMLANIQSASQGPYGVVVSNVFGAATNVIYTVTAIDSPPVIYEQPTSQLFVPGGNVTLRTLAYGTAPLSFKWWYNSNALAGATNSLLPLKNLGPTNAGAYFVTISNVFGVTNSFSATLALGDPYPGQVDWPAFTFAQVVTNLFDTPVCVSHSRDGSGRLFVVEQSGRIRIVQSNNVLPAPFLLITNRVLKASEEGLLGLAFPPGFSTNGHFYVDYSRKPDAATVISRFGLTADPNVADTNSEQVILVIPQPFANDKGGQLGFGPDGYLYVGLGDGGETYTGGDPNNNAQNPASWLGKLLRIDVEGGTLPYAVPANNPFVGNTNYLPEIWAVGLRNPWRFSFDRGTGDLYIGDVGESRYEEIDFQPGGSAGGQNYGWRIMEGPVTYRVPAGFTNFSQFTAPVFSYYHAFSSAAVIGGYVYRGPSEPRMNGIYFLGDRATGLIRALKQVGTTWQNFQVGPASFAIATFGEDQPGNLYVADYYGGRVYQIQDTHQILAPSFLPAGGTIYSNSVAVKCLTPGVLIHYTTDGRNPTEADPWVPAGGTIQVNNGIPVKIQAFRPDLIPSQVVSGTFTFTVAPLVFNPPSGPITNGTSISISCSTPGATIYYTLDGTSPTTNSPLYTAPLVINGGTTVNAQAFESGYLSSPASSVFYPLVQTATPVFDPPSGPVAYGATVAISCATPYAQIFYTLDGTPATTNSPVYSNPITVLGDLTLTAFAVSDGHLDSAVRSVSYTLIKPATPAFNPSQGPLTNNAVISITCVTAGAVIHYTVDGTDPDTNSPVVSVPLLFNGPITLKARAFANHLDPSDIQSTFFGLLDMSHTIVTTLAGARTGGFTNGSGTSARFSSPQGICIDRAGNLYVADTGNNVIRKILPSGQVTTFAGTGVSGSQLGPATNAQFSGPTGVCLDGSGNLYVADSGNCNRICRVDTNGMVTTFANVTLCGPGIGNYAAGLWQLETGPDGNIYVGYWASVRKILPDGTVLGLAGTGCNCPGGWGLNVGPGIDALTNVYSATGNNLWKTDPSNYTELFAGGIGAFSDGPRLLAGFYNLADAAVDSSTNILLSDTIRIRKIRPDGWVSTLAGTGVSGYHNGDGSLAQFNNAAGLCVDGSGTIYMADSGNNCIRVISPDTYGIGIPDSWQLAHFGYIGIDPKADPDHDGMSNYAEFWAGTDPNDAKSVFKIVNAAVINGSAQLSWNSVSGKAYVVRYSNDLVSWTVLGNPIPGSGSVVSFTDPAPIAQGGGRFYQISLADP